MKSTTFTAAPMALQHLEVRPLTGKLAGRFGIKSKRNKWFHYHYSTESSAQHIAHKIESDWTTQIDDVNFSAADYPISPAGEGL